jgi:AcrR family transcriptional regulator
VRSVTGWDQRHRLRLGVYEQIALELFAEHGFRNVTFDAIAEAAGVSARTLFRYFPTKEDFLVGYPRRLVTSVVETIAALPTSDTPIETAWYVVRRVFAEVPPDVTLLSLWRRAAAGAPEVHAQVRGERTQRLFEAVGAYCARSLGADPSADPRPVLLAGIVAGVEFGLAEMYGASGARLPEILDVADGLVFGLDGAIARR